MKNILFISCPAAGKGTQSSLLVTKCGYEHISTGDLLREEIYSNSDLGKEINEIMKNGMFVDDAIVTNLLVEKIKKLDKPFILDGYPRNIKQAEILDKILQEQNKKIDCVIEFQVDKEIALKRICGRMICPKCHKSYHKYYNKPLIENLCDECQTELISRSDDTEETFFQRYDTYMKNTYPLISFYSQKKIIYNIDCNNDNPEEIFEKILSIVKEEDEK